MMDFYLVLSLGFFIGMQHALEADHLAAVAALTHEHGSRRALVLRGSVWGLGHTITLAAICGVLLVLGRTISPRVEAGLELAVGCMIIGLGANVLYGMWRRRLHIHVHRHGDGLRHIHVHGHATESTPHELSSHDHAHENLRLGRALLVGMMHGAAGSAGLLMLAAASGSTAQAVGYVIAFGIGSIAGMAALSFVASFPIRFVERYATWLNTAAFACIGGAAMVVGARLVVESWAAL